MAAEGGGVLRRVKMGGDHFPNSPKGGHNPLLGPLPPGREKHPAWRRRGGHRSYGSFFTRTGGALPPHQPGGLTKNRKRGPQSPDPKKKPGERGALHVKGTLFPNMPKCKNNKTYEGQGGPKGTPGQP